MMLLAECNHGIKYRAVRMRRMIRGVSHLLVTCLFHLPLISENLNSRPPFSFPLKRVNPGATSIIDHSRRLSISSNLMRQY